MANELSGMLANLLPTLQEQRAGQRQEGQRLAGLLSTPGATLSYLAPERAANAVGSVANIFGVDTPEQAKAKALQGVNLSNVDGMRTAAERLRSVGQEAQAQRLEQTAFAQEKLEQEALALKSKEEAEKLSITNGLAAQAQSIGKFTSDPAYANRIQAIYQGILQRTITTQEEFDDAVKLAQESTGQDVVTVEPMENEDEKAGKEALKALGIGRVERNLLKDALPEIWYWKERYSKNLSWEQAITLYRTAASAQVQGPTGADEFANVTEGTALPQGSANPPPRNTPSVVADTIQANAPRHGLFSR